METRIVFEASSVKMVIGYEVVIQSMNEASAACRDSKVGQKLAEIAFAETLI
jgi:hypothetical protein